MSPNLPAVLRPSVFLFYRLQMIELKFVTFISRRYQIFSNAVHCRSLLIAFRAASNLGTGRPTKYCLLGNATKQQPTVDTILPKLRLRLDCSQTKAEEIYSFLTKREYPNVDSVEECIDFLKQNGVSSSITLDNPWLLLLPLEDMKEKMKILQKVGVVLDTIPLLRLPRGHLKSVVNHWLEEAETISKNFKSSNRLQFFADKLQCSCYEVAMLMERHYYLLTMDFNRIARVMGLLLECGIPSQEIKNDLWIFSFKEGFIQERIEKVREAHVDPIKIWMLRCEEYKFAKKMEKWIETKTVLGIHKDVESYLAERLKCNKDDVATLHKKYAKFSTISVLKLKANLDFLFESGFTPEEVRAAPRALGHSINTFAVRLQELKRLKYPYINLRMLFATAREYERLVNKIHNFKK